MNAHSLKADEAQVVPNRLGSATSWQIYRPDGYYAKLVHTCMTQEEAVQICQKNCWKIAKGY